MYTKFENLSEEKKKLIIESALEEFAYNGYHKASTDKIANNSNIAKGSLFHYFGSKKKLYLYIVTYCMDFMGTMVREEANNIESKDFFERVKLISIYKQNLFLKYPNEINIVIEAMKDNTIELKEELKDLINKYTTENIFFLNEYIIKYMDKKNLKENVEVQDAIFMTMTVFEGLRKKYQQINEKSETKNIITKKAFEEFDRYIEILKSGLYKSN